MITGLLGKWRETPRPQDSGSSLWRLPVYTFEPRLFIWNSLSAPEEVYASLPLIYYLGS